MTTGTRKAKRRIEILVGKYLANPLVRALVRYGLNPPGLGLVETTGRKTGLTRQVPVAYAADETGAWLIAQHGRNSGWALNLEATPQVRLRVGRTWHSGTARLVADDDIAARRKVFAASRIGQALAAITLRALETDPVSVRVDFHDRPA